MGTSDASQHHILQSNEEEERPERRSLLNSSSPEQRRQGRRWRCTGRNVSPKRMPPVELRARVDVKSTWCGEFSTSHVLWHSLTAARWRSHVGHVRTMLPLPRYTHVRPHTVQTNMQCNMSGNTPYCPNVVLEKCGKTLGSANMVRKRAVAHCAWFLRLVSIALKRSLSSPERN